MRTLFRTILFLVAFLSFLPCAAAGKKYRSELDIRYGERRTELVDGYHDADRFLNIYYPDSEEPDKGFPVVMFIHGGGFKDGHKGLNSVGKGLLERGYAIVSVDYFLAYRYGIGNEIPCSEQMKDGFPPGGRYAPFTERAVEMASEDILMALKWLWKNSRKYSLDRSCIALCGGSAGAITSLWTAFVKHPRKPRIKAVINCWGAIDDISRINTPHCPVLTIHGDSDPFVNISYGKAIYNRMLEIKSRESDLVILEGMGHSEYRYVGNNLMDRINDFLVAAGMQ